MLFSLLVNDLPTVASDICTIIQYADDTQVMVWATSGVDRHDYPASGSPSKISCVVLSELTGAQCQQITGDHVGL